MIGCDSEDWLIDRVRDGRFPARKIVRQLRFIDADIEAILNACINEPRGRESEPLVPVPVRRRRAHG
jgi:proline racemase